jgi:hypothetical protein
MTDLAVSIMTVPHPRRIAWFRTGFRTATGIATLALIALWLWALPALLSRQGFVQRGDEVCAQPGWRDPVTGRPSPAPSHRCPTGRTGS